MEGFIAVLARPMKNEYGRCVTALYDSIKEMIYENNFIPLLIIPNLFESKNIESAREILKLCKGIIFTGGSDIYPYDLELIKYVYENDIPVLGICLGMQTMSVFKDGIMKDFDSNKHLSKDYYVHKIRIDKDSILYKILGKNEIKVNSRHISYIDETKLDISSISEDGFIESVEDKNKKCFIGTQFHIEDMKDENAKKIITYFIERCRENEDK